MTKAEKATMDANFVLRNLGTEFIACPRYANEVDIYKEGYFSWLLGMYSKGMLNDYKESLIRMNR